MTEGYAPEVSPSWASRAATSSIGFHAKAPRDASAEAAAVAAADRVLEVYSPEQEATLDAAYEASLDGIRDGRAERRGIRYGERAANTLIAQRAGDGRNDPAVTFTMAPGPGVWEPTPPAFAPFQVPWLAEVDPLLVPSPETFGDPGPPPSLTSRRYTRDFNEVKAMGSLTSTERDADETETALFYSGNPIVQFTRGLQDQAVVRDLDLVDSARTFAAVHMSLADASISIWQSKLTYGFWRPITAIQRADTDGNDATTADPTWNSLIPAPPNPDYVSGYNGIMGAYTQALQDTFEQPAPESHADHHRPDGRTADRQPVLQLRSRGPAGGHQRRVWLGIHFRFADTAAARMGRQVATYGLDHYFQPVHHHHS